jgi:uncharacterized membrane-anchored protein YhcB (DUF1043 family)
MPRLTDEASQFIGAILNRISRPGNRRAAEMLVFAERLDNIDERVASTQKSLDKFAKAIELYAGHLASHTSAIQELSRSASELRESSAEQNRVLAHITESIFAQKERPVAAPPETEETVATSEFVRELERRTREARKIKYGLQGLFVQDIRERTATAWEAARNLDNMVGIHYVDGCNVKRPINYRELHTTGHN